MLIKNSNNLTDQIQNLRFQKIFLLVFKNVLSGPDVITTVKDPPKAGEETLPCQSVVTISRFFLKNSIAFHYYFKQIHYFFEQTILRIDISDTKTSDQTSCQK